MAKVLVIGSGGREHALALKFSQSPSVSEVYVAPGNPGMTLDNENLPVPIQTVAIDALDKEGLVAFALDKEIDLSFVGPETSLAAGVVDIFRDKGLAIIGPDQEAAQIESSKAFAKDMMVAAGVPTAGYQAFKAQDYDQALAYLNQQTSGYVIKEDGLAAGKGVYILDNLAEAQATLKEVMLDLKSDLVIEELLSGPELSYFSLVNEDHIIPLAIAQDYKRAHDGDQGLNTGGMGAISPVPGYPETELMEEINQLVVRPLIKEMAKQGVPYTGILYTGLMMTDQGPKVIEFNARFGDPETQVVLGRLEDDFYQVCLASLKKEDRLIHLTDDISMGVVLAAQGYPSTYQKGMELGSAVDEYLNQIRFAGVQQDQAGNYVTSGGRILMVLGQAESVKGVRKEIYQILENLGIENTFYRTDIAKKFEEE